MQSTQEKGNCFRVFTLTLYLGLDAFLYARVGPGRVPPGRRTAPLRCAVTSVYCGDRRCPTELRWRWGAGAQTSMSMEGSDVG